MTIEMVPAPRETVETVGKGDVHYTVDNFFGSVVEKGPGPQVFHVHQGADDVTAPHFHGVPQFQVFTGGDGMFGRTEVSTPALHYADAWTSYGPIIAGGSGIDYFTARVHADVGAGWMPEARKTKPHKSGRHFTFELGEFCRAVPESGETSTHSLIPTEGDGLSALVVVLPPGQSHELTAFTGSGRLITILRGGLTAEGETFGQWSWGFQAGPGDACAIEAAKEGAIVLCCDYPAFEWIPSS